MRNEEMETRLTNQGRKLWSLKQICLEQQKQLKRQALERSVLVKELRAYKNITEENMIICKNHYYDIYDRLKSGCGNDYRDIYENMKSTKVNLDEVGDERNKLIRQLESQIDMSI